MASKKVGNFEIQGLKELQKQLLTFDKDIMKKATKKAVKEAMEPVANHAKSMVPVGTGALHDSIKVSSGSTDQGKQNRVAWAVVKAGGKAGKGATGPAPGGYVLSTHYGTGNQDGKPFLLDAFTPYGQQIATHFKNQLTTETEKGVATMARRAKNKK